MPARSLGEDLVQGLPDAVVLVDEGFRFLFVNAATERLYGIPRDELLGRCMWDVFPQAVGTPAYEESLRAMKTRTRAGYETYWAPWKKWFEVTVAPSGPNIVFQFRDVTRRKLTDELLRGEKRALDLAMHDAPLARTLEELVLTLERCVGGDALASILLVDDGRLYTGAAPNLPQAYSDALEGLAIGPAVGSCGTAAYTGELVVAKDLRTDDRWKAFRELVDTHGLRSCWSMPVHASDGRRVLATFALYGREPSDGPVPEVVEIVSLLSTTAALVIERDREAKARGAAAAELAAAKTVAERANRAKDEFLAMLGHELRNPLAPIVTALRLMDLRDEPASRPARAVIARQVEHLTRLVDDLLDVSRIASGRIVLEDKTTEVAGIVARAIEMTSPLFEQRRQELVVEADADLWVRGDATRLAQVVANLLTNAAKYSDVGTKTTLVAKRSGDRLRLEVRDQGIGIAPAVLPHVFELFTQAEQALDRAQGGLGLGLAIVRNLVRMHGGEVTATSEGLGRGSTFTIDLPLAAPERDTAVTSKAKPLDRASTSRRILVVDDNEDVAQMLAEVLGEVGHEVRTANDGPEALEMARSFAPHAVLLDIGLPVMDGFAVARALREDSELQPSFLVAITGYGREQDRVRTREAGFDAHLVKPVQVDAVLRLLEKRSL